MSMIAAGIAVSLFHRRVICFLLTIWLILSIIADLLLCIFSIALAFPSTEPNGSYLWSRVMNRWWDWWNQINKVKDERMLKAAYSLCRVRHVMVQCSPWLSLFYATVLETNFTFCFPLFSVFVTATAVHEWRHFIVRYTTGFLLNDADCVCPVMQHCTQISAQQVNKQKNKLPSPIFLITSCHHQLF